MYMLLAVCLLIFDKNVNAGDTQYSASDDSTRGNLFERSDNINLHLQEKTKEVVMMEHLARIDPVKVRP